MSTVNGDGCARREAVGSLLQEGTFGDSEDCSRKLEGNPSTMQDELGQIKRALKMVRDLTAGQRYHLWGRPTKVW